MGLAIVLFLSILGQESKAQDFVFTFVNPAFGGNPYNYSWLLQSADKQNKYDDKEQKEADDFFSRDPLENFQEDLNYSILSNLSNKISNDLLGTNQSLSPGNYEIGDYNIRITKKSNGINITIMDQKTGNSTTMLIPNSTNSNNNQ